MELIAYSYDSSDIQDLERHFREVTVSLLGDEATGSWPLYHSGLLAVVLVYLV